MDFNNDLELAASKISHLKDVEWIDNFTRGIALRWTIFNRFDRNFYIVTVLCEMISGPQFY